MKGIIAISVIMLTVFSTFAIYTPQVKSPPLEVVARAPSVYVFLFDERRAGADTLDYEYSDIAQILQDQGHTVDSTTDPITSSILLKYDILVITCPYGYYTVSELQAIESFVEGGNGLLLMGQWHISDPTGINQVAGLFGVTFLGNGAVRDPDYPSTYEPIITKFAAVHPVCAEINSIAIYGGRVLSIGSNTPLAWGDSNTYGDLNNNGQYDTGEPIGSEAVVMATAQPGSGRAVFISDTDLFDNDFLQDYDNQNLFFNIISWLARARWELKMAQLIDAIAEAKQAALDFSEFNLNQGVNICGEMVAEIAGDVAGVIFSEVLLSELGFDFKELPMPSQQILSSIDVMVAEMTEEALSNTEIASEVSRSIMSEFAYKAGFPCAANLTKLQDLYQSYLDAMIFHIEVYIDLWKESGPPANLDFMLAQWSSLLNQYTNSLKRAKTLDTFYISPRRIGTIGQSAEAIRWWNSPLHNLSNSGLLALSATGILFGHPELAYASKMLTLAKDAFIMGIWTNVMKRIVEENIGILEDSYTILFHCIVPAGYYPELFAKEPGEIERTNFPSVDFINRSVNGTVDYRYDWPVRSEEVRVSAAFFDPDGNFLYSSLSDPQPTDASDLSFKIQYHFPTLQLFDYLTKYAADRRMQVKLFVHQFDADVGGYSTDYLLGPFETSVKVELLDLEILMFELGSPADLHVYDSEGRHVGLNYTSGGWDLGIPDAFYSGESSPQIVLIPQPEGNYTVSIFGTSEGDFSLKTSYIHEGVVTDAITNQSQIRPSENRIYYIELLPDGKIEVVPEFHSLIIIPLLMITLLGAILLKRKRYSKR